MAGSTGLEPAASAVTGQRSNQLNYDPNTAMLAIGELVNERIGEWQSPIRHFLDSPTGLGGTGFEPVTAGV